MRIALLTADWRPNGGVASYVRLLSTALVRAGHDLIVLQGDPSSVGQPLADVDVRDVPNAFYVRASSDTALAARVGQTLRSFSPDVVHALSNNNFALENLVRRSHPLVKTFHVHEYCPTGEKYHFGPEKPCAVRTGLMCVPRMGYLRCTLTVRPNVIWSMYRHTRTANRHHRGLPRVILCSEHLRQQAIFTGFIPERLTVVPYFTEVPPASTPPAHREVLFVGRLVRSKGVDLLLDALAQIRAPWTAVIVGAGQERAALERRASALGLADRVTFPGWLTGPALDAAYERAGVVVVPSRWPEPFGIVGLEAMARGRPVVAFNVGGIPEWLEEGRGGSLVAPLDTRGLAERMAWFLDHPEEAAAIAARGRTRVAHEFSSRAHLDRLLPVYERVREAR